MAAGRVKAIAAAERPAAADREPPFGLPALLGLLDCQRFRWAVVVETPVIAPMLRMLVGDVAPAVKLAVPPLPWMAMAVLIVSVWLPFAGVVWITPPGQQQIAATPGIFVGGCVGEGDAADIPVGSHGNGGIRCEAQSEGRSVSAGGGISGFWCRGVPPMGSDGPSAGAIHVPCAVYCLHIGCGHESAGPSAGKAKECLAKVLAGCSATSERIVCCNCDSWCRETFLRAGKAACIRMTAFSIGPPSSGAETSPPVSALRGERPSMTASRSPSLQNNVRRVPLEVRSSRVAWNIGTDILWSDQWPSNCSDRAADAQSCAGSTHLSKALSTFSPAFSTGPFGSTASLAFSTALSTFSPAFSAGPFSLQETTEATKGNIHNDNRNVVFMCPKLRDRQWLFYGV